MTAFGIVIGLATLLFAVLTFLQGRATERRALESRDVVWSREPIDGGWAFEHSGATTVSEVKIVLTVDGTSEITRIDTLAPDTPLPAMNSKHEATQADAKAEDEEYERELSDFDTRSTRTVTSGLLSFELPDRKTPPFPRVGWRSDCSAIIAWRYPSGVPDTHEMSWVEEY